MQNIIIDEEFKSLLPALDKETYAALEENLLSNGCRDALILWNDILIDGYNRYELCSKHDIAFSTVSKDFDSREEVLIWIISNQVSRRNLTQMQLSFYRGLHYKADKKIVKNESGKNQHSEVIAHNEHKPQNQSTMTRLAKQYNVAPITIRRDSRVSDAIEAIGAISPDAKRKILSGVVDVSKKELESLLSNHADDIVALAVEIEDGTYERRHLGKPSPDQIDSLADSISAELERLDSLIDNTVRAFNLRLRKLSEYGGIAEYKTALRSCINTLQKMYKSI